MPCRIFHTDRVGGGGIYEIRSGQKVHNGDYRVVTGDVNSVILVCREGISRQGITLRRPRTDIFRKIPVFPDLNTGSRKVGFVETGMNGNGSHPSMKNCEGTTGIRNRLLRSLGRSFLVIEAPRGRPFLVRRRSSQRDWHFPKVLELRNFQGKPKSSTICESLLSEGTVPFPPLTAPAFCDCIVLPSPEVIASGECHSGGSGGISCRCPKRALRKIF